MDDEDGLLGHGAAEHIDTRKLFAFLQCSAWRNQAFAPSRVPTTMFPPCVALICVVVGAAWSQGAAFQKAVGPSQPVDPARDDRFGTAIARAGDVDGDGIGDILIGAPQDVPVSGENHYGCVWVFSGKTGRILRCLSGPARLGVALAGGVDLDSDRVLDIVAGSGRAVTIYSGASGATLHEVAVPAQCSDSTGIFAHRVATAQRTGSGGPAVLISPWRWELRSSDCDRLLLLKRAEREPGTMRIAAEPLVQERLDPAVLGDGALLSVARAGDIDGDGKEDWLAATVRGVRNPSYKVFLISGSNWSVMRTLEPPAPCNGNEFGVSLAGAGDLDGDGRLDLLVGSATSAFSNSAACRAGHVYAYSEGVLMFDLTEGTSDDGFGCVIDGGMDATGDGIPDILVAVNNMLALGARLYSGKDGALVHKVYGDIFREYVGVNVAFLDDIDGDRCAEFAVANHPTGMHVPQSGEVVVYSGATGEKLHVLRSGR